MNALSTRSARLPHIRTNSSCVIAFPFGPREYAVGQQVRTKAARSTTLLGIPQSRMVRSDHFLPEQAQRVTPKDSAAKTDPRLFRVMGRYNQTVSYTHLRAHET